MSRFTNQCYRFVIREVSCTRYWQNYKNFVTSQRVGLGNYTSSSSCGLGRVHGCLLDLSNEPIHEPVL
uniref:Uncharacterized protein n=1 Tax=Helianthus annuus TaxID=4232 RepID=A0A251VBP2_HELAN